MTLVYGWWDWDAEASSLDNRVTGERVVCRGPAAVPGSSGQWLRFDYLHPELKFPILVEQETAPEELERGRPFWRVDYRKSSELWQVESNSKAGHPSYGVWRRVDDCVSDALTCWPAAQDFPAEMASYLLLDGGWVNGVWSEKMRRSERRLESKHFLPDAEDYNPWLFPLDAVPPSPFEFHDLEPEGGIGRLPEIDNPVLLRGLKFEDPEKFFDPSLPPDSDFTELKNRTVYALSKDGKRLLYPFYGDTERPPEVSHWQSRFGVLYADDQVLVSCSTRPNKRSRHGAMWLCSCFGRGLSLQPQKKASVFFLKPRNDVTPIPSRPLWLQIKWGVADAWCCWNGSRVRYANWLEDLHLIRADGVTEHNGYRGGKWSSHAIANFWREKAKSGVLGSGLALCAIRVNGNAHKPRLGPDSQNWS